MSKGGLDYYKQSFEEGGRKGCGGPGQPLCSESGSKEPLGPQQKDPNISHSVSRKVRTDINGYDPNVPLYVDASNEIPNYNNKQGPYVMSPTSDENKFEGFINNEVQKGFKDRYDDPITRQRLKEQSGMTDEEIDNSIKYGLSAKRIPIPSGASNKGQYYNETHEMFYADKEAGIHESIHASGIDARMSGKIQEVLGNPFKQNKKNNWTNIKKYMSMGHESYANFAEFREKIGLKPGEQIDKKQLKLIIDKNKDLKNDNFYKTFDDDKIIEALNTVASTSENSGMVMAQDGGGKTSSVDYGTPEYEKAHSEGRFRDVPNQLDEVVVTADNKTGKNILEQYPFYNQLSVQDKENFRDSSPIGSQIRARAKDGEGFNAKKARSLVQGMLVDTPLSTMQVGQSALVEGIEAIRGNKSSFENVFNPGKQRVPSETLGYEDPQGFLENAANIGMDVVVDPSNIVGGGLAKNALRTATKKTGKAGLKTINNTFNNLKDLEYAKEFAQKFDYDFPIDIKTISKSSDLTDSTIKELMDRHNTFARGVSTNWKELERRNPEILRHLEGKGIDWENNPQAAAEYMATHIPIDTGYGRASLNSKVFNRGEDALYASNSFKTAEGYTYGDGFVVKAKKPTDYSSASRKDWIDKNQLNYNENSFPESKSKSEVQRFVETGLMINPKKNKSHYARFIGEKNVEKILDNDKQLSEARRKVFKKYNIDESKGLYAVSEDEIRKAGSEDKAFTLKNADVGKAIKEAEVINKELNKKLINNLESFENPEKMKSLLKTESSKDSKYAHYIHIGKPGDKVLDVVDTRRVTPDTFKNKSRAHTNTYSKGLSAGAFTGLAINAANKE